MFEYDKSKKLQDLRNAIDAGQYSSIDVAEHLKNIQHLPKDYLREMRYQLGTMAHGQLIRALNEGHIEGLAIADDSCPGMVSDALSSNDGSSKYLRFSMTMSDEAARESAEYFHDANLAAPEQARIKLLRTCAENNDLAADLLIGTAPLADPSSGCSIFCGQQTYQAPLATSDKPQQKLSVTVQRELAAIGCLCALITTCDRLLHTDSQADIQSLVTTLPFRQLEATEQEYLDKTKLIREASASAWKSLSEYHESYRLPSIALGESFTLGKLAQCLTSYPNRENQTAYTFGWYHPDAKKIFGVDPDQLHDDTIAEVRAVLQGAAGLLMHGFGEPGISIATSGWANNVWLTDTQTGTMNDFFSVAAAYAHEDTTYAVGLRVSLPDTATSEASPARRQYTRELGVLAGLYVLSKVLNDDQTSMTLQNVSDDLMTILSTYGLCQEVTSSTPLT